jgi:hypothetical protein
MDLRRLWLVGLMALTLAGCSSAQLEPDDAFVDLPEMHYPFDVVFESLAASVQDEGFDIDSSQHEGDRAEFTTHVKWIRKDHLTDVEEGRRIRAKISPAGEKYRVRLAASVLEKQPGEDWSYVERDEALHQKVAGNLSHNLSKRYTSDGD